MSSQASPNKRRKLDKDTTPKKPNRSLDFFFNTKQKQQAALQNASHSFSEAAAEDEILSDEQLARRLQEEWNKADDAAPALSQSDMYEPPKLDAESKDPVDSPVESLPLRDAATEVQDNSKPTTLTLQSAAATEDTISCEISFDQSPLTFEPSEHIPRLQRQWSLEGGNATYALLTRCFVLVNSTQSRIKIVDTLVNLLRILIEGDPESLLPAVWLATNSISPPYIDLELGLGGSAISKALQKVCGLNSAGLRTLYNKHGDAGDVAFEAKKRQSLTLRKPKPLSIKSVFGSLVTIANSKGHGSVEVKQRIVERLVQDARGAEESRYIVRTLVQHLRIGAVKTTMLIALSRAFILSRPPSTEFPLRDQKELAKLKKEELAMVWSRNEEIVKACFSRRPNYNDLIPTLLEIGVCDELLLRCGLALHIPLRPMLGNITRDLGDMLTKLQGRDFTCEYKYDGQRAQIHCDERGKVTIFSRHLEVMTDKYPDLVELVPKIRGEGVSSFILEGEVVAVDRSTGGLKTFQTLANRARKDVVIGAVTIDVCLFAFDLMFLNGEELLNRPFRERRGLLRSLFTEIPHHFTWVQSFDATSMDADAVSSFFQQATDIKCEGLMVKILDNAPNPDLQAALADEDITDVAATTAPSPAPTAKAKVKSKPRVKKTDTKSILLKDWQDTSAADAPSHRRKALVSTYEPDKRVDSWLKVKKDYHTTTDTLDLIPIAGWHGQGRKSKWWSPILLAVRCPTTGALQAVTKCISGFTDAFYIANRERYDPGGPNVIARPAYVEYAGSPDVWFEPAEVWEMIFADVTLSPTYSAAIGLVSEERGLSLRFPRFLKVRDDKGLDEASTDEYLASLWRKQEAKAAIEGGNAVKEEDKEDGGVDASFEY